MYMVYILIVAEVDHAVGPDISINVHIVLGVLRYGGRFVLMD
jgi:hypothetical protein